MPATDWIKLEDRLGSLGATPYAISGTASASSVISKSMCSESRWLTYSVTGGRRAVNDSRLPAARAARRRRAIALFCRSDRAGRVAHVDRVDKPDELIRQ